MLKKLIVVAVVGGLAVAAVKGTKFASYIRTEVHSWREAAEDAVPPEKEIERLRGEVKMLDEDTIKIVKQLARLMSDQSDISVREKGLEAKKSQVGELMTSREVAVREAEKKLQTYKDWLAIPKPAAPAGLAKRITDVKKESQAKTYDAFMDLIPLVLETDSSRIVTIDVFTG